MTIYTDAINNYFIGDVLYGNHDIVYSTISYTKAEKLTGSNLNTQITSVCNSLGINRLITGDLTFPTMNNDFQFSFPGDTLNYRFQFAGTGGSGGYFLMRGRNNIGSNAFGRLTSTSAEVEYIDNTDEFSEIFERQFCAVFSTQSIGLFFIRRKIANPNNARYSFMYAGYMQDGTIPAFNSSILAKSIIFSNTNMFSTGELARGWHFDVASQANKEILKTGTALYNITCADLQTPGVQHSTGFYALYNDGVLYPMMGRFHNLLFAQGTYIIGKPVKIDGTVFQDAGHNHWLPVSRWGTYTILMRCYSSLV